MLAGLLAFVAYFGVYRLHEMIALQIGNGWALAGAVLVAAGASVIAAIGVVMIETRIRQTGAGSRDR